MAGNPNADERSEPVKKALSVIDLGTQAARAYERDDLVTRLELAKKRLNNPTFQVFVVGEFKQGKSSLVNALLNAPVCPVDDDIATAAPTAIRYAEEPKAAILLKPTIDGLDGGDERTEPVREEISIDEVVQYVTETASPGSERQVQAVEVSIPRKMLADGLVIVDTPGVGGLGSAHSAATIGALPMADAVVFVSDASQEYTAPELEFLQTARKMCRNIVCVMTKIDFYPAWRKIRDLNADHLRNQRIRTPLVCVSSALRIHALRSNDRQLNQESGFPELVGYLQNEIAGNAEKLMVRNAANDVASVAGLLASQFQNERQALQSPDAARAMVEDLGELKEKAAQLKSDMSRWQQTLSDGILDLQTDLDHDLKGRLRQIAQVADEAIEQSDPAETWPEFEPWLVRRVAEEVGNSYAFLHSRANDLSQRVATHFGEAGGDLALRVDVPSPGELLASIDPRTSVDTDKMGVGDSALSGLRGGYGGYLMFSMISTMAGVGGMIINPVAAAAGLFMGRKAVKDQRTQQLNLRRSQAKQAHRKYADDVSFVVTKDARDSLRRIQRQLRDLFTGRAEEIHKSTTDSLNAAQQAAKADETTRKQRLKDVTAELERIGALRKKALALAPELARATNKPAKAAQGAQSASAKATQGRDT